MSKSWWEVDWHGYMDQDVSTCQRSPVGGLKTQIVPGCRYLQAPPPPHTHTHTPNQPKLSGLACHYYWCQKPDLPKLIPCPMTWMTERTTMSMPTTLWMVMCWSSGSTDIRKLLRSMVSNFLSIMTKTKQELKLRHRPWEEIQTFNKEMKLGKIR